MSPDPDIGFYEYTVDLPVGTYDVVASSEGFDPDTATGVALTSGALVNDIDLEL